MQPAKNLLHHLSDPAPRAPVPLAARLSGTGMRDAILRAVDGSAVLHVQSMEAALSGFQEKSSAGREGNSAAPENLSTEAIKAKARDFISIVAGRREWNETREAWLGRAAYKLGLPYARVKRLFYREVARVPADEYLALKVRARIAVEDQLARQADMQRLRDLADKLRDA